MVTGSMADRVLRGYRDEENRLGSDIYRRLKDKPDRIKKVWSEP